MIVPNILGHVSLKLEKHYFWLQHIFMEHGLHLRTASIPVKLPQIPFLHLVDIIEILSGHAAQTEKAINTAIEMLTQTRT